MHPETEVEAMVARLYMAYFLRQPDSAGYAYWSRVLAETEANLYDLSWQFSTSDEFVSTYGDLDHQGFLDLIYENVLCRDVDAAGYAYWLDLLQTNQIRRPDAVLYFSEGQEFRQLSGTASFGASSTTR